MKIIYSRRKKFKPDIPVVIHHDDGHRQLERVDLSQALRHDESSVQEQHSDADCGEDEQSVLVMEELESEDNTNDHESMSTYNKRVERKQKAREDLRSETIKRTFQFAGQTSCPCIICGEKEAPYQCQDCSYNLTFCHDCVVKLHTTINVYHNVEVLQVSLLDN